MNEMVTSIPWPAGLQRIADAVGGEAGVEAALTLSLERGGSRLDIPRKAPGSVLAETVGLPAARLIVAALAGERIEVPTARKIVAHWLLGQGWSQERVAVRMKICRRTVQHWAAGSTPSRQLDLFCERTEDRGQKTDGRTS